MSDLIVNKVANSGITTLDLEQYLPREAVTEFDLKEHLFMGLILKEKDFREALKNMDWQVYEQKNVAIFCSVDAVIPVWAYMLVVTYLQPFAREHPFLRGMRVSLSIDNLFDARQQVRDRLGATPLSYQPGYLDPLGRSVRLSVRKLFF